VSEIPWWGLPLIAAVFALAGAAGAQLVTARNDYARNTSWRFLRDWDFSADKTVVSTDPAVAAVSSKAGCSTSGLSASQQTACTNQWNDYTPGTPRYGIWTRDHKRASAELTAQYEFSKNFNAYVSYQHNKQEQRLNDRNWGTDFGAVTRLANAGNAPTAARWARNVRRFTRSAPDRQRRSARSTLESTRRPGGGCSRTSRNGCCPGCRAA